MTARDLALRIFLGTALVVVLVGGAVLLALDQSDDASRDVATVDRKAATNTREIGRNREQIRVVRRTTILNRTKIIRQDRILVRSGIARRGADGRLGATGRTGRAGRDAAPLTPAMVLTQLRALCGDCRGVDGADGRDGADGAPGEPLTQAQVDEAVARLLPGCFASGACPVPAPGPPGPQGEPAAQVPCAQQDPALGYVCQPVVP